MINTTQKGTRKMNQKTVIGVDPGLKGAIAVITQEAYAVHDVPTLTVEGSRRRSARTGKMTTKKSERYDVAEIRRLITQIRDNAHANGLPVELWVEDVHPMPGEGSMGAFSLGKAMMLWEVAACWADIPFSKVHPMTWKRVMMNGMGRKKDAAVARAQELFPNAVLRGPMGGLKDGRAEALLIAKYGAMN